MIKSDGLIRLLLKKGRQTTEEELKENYIKLQRFTHSKEETQELQDLYDRAYQFLEEEKENRRSQFLKQINRIEETAKMNFSREYLQQLVRELKNSVYFSPKKEGRKQVTDKIFLEGILKYRTPFGIANYINAYRVKEEEDNLYTILNVPSLDSFGYRKLVNEKLFCKKNREEAKINRGGYLGVIRETEKQRYVFEIDEEQMAACIAYKEKIKSIRREGRE